MVCKDLVTEPILQDVEGEQLIRGLNKVHGARLDIHACGYWEPQQSAIFDVRFCHKDDDDGDDEEEEEEEEEDDDDEDDDDDNDDDDDDDDDDDEMLSHLSH